MVVEIDQSGKLEQLDTDTVVAFSNDTSDLVLIKAGTKRKIVQHLRTTLLPHKDLYPILFAIVIFILIKPLNSLVILKIDEEYTGKEAVIKETLEKLLIRRFGIKWQGVINFGRIGKHSNAHSLAWKTHRSRKKIGVKKISEKEILELL